MLAMRILFQCFICAHTSNKNDSRIIIIIPNKHIALHKINKINTIRWLRINRRSSINGRRAQNHRTEIEIELEICHSTRHSVESVKGERKCSGIYERIVICSSSKRNARAVWLEIHWNFWEFIISLKNQKMACAFGCLGSISAVIVAIQFFAKVVPWFYENIIGPMILGPKFKLRDYGEWACK